MIKSVHKIKGFRGLAYLLYRSRIIMVVKMLRLSPLTELRTAYYYSSSGYDVDGLHCTFYITKVGSDFNLVPRVFSLNPEKKALGTRLL